MLGRSRDEQPLDRLVDRAPLVLVGLVAAQEVEARRPAAMRSREVRGRAGHAGRQVAAVGSMPAL